MTTAPLDLNFENGQLLLNNEAFKPRFGENVQRIRLDAGLHSDLDWSEALKSAESIVAQEQLILWELDLGLFKQLTQSLDDQAQFSTLCLAIEHFGKTIWPQFASASLGVSLMDGDGDFRSNFPWGPKEEENLRSWLSDHTDSPELDELSIVELKAHRITQLFCRDAGAQYLELLAARLPDDAHAFAFLDFNSVNCSWLRTQLASPEAFEYIHLITEPKAPGFSHVNSPEIAALSAGICIPQLPGVLELSAADWNNAVQHCEKKWGALRFIPESQITMSWHGLDNLAVFSTQLSPQGLRMLQGFCAAGGTVLSLGPKLGLASEENLSI